jgi:hypothetical protein
VRPHLLRDVDEVIVDHAQRHAVDRAPPRRPGGSLDARDAQDPGRADGEAGPGREERRRVVLLDHRRPGQLAPGRQVGALVDRRAEPAGAGEEDVTVRGRLGGRALREVGRARARGLADGADVEVNELDRLVAEAVAEGRLVSVVKG